MKRFLKKYWHWLLATLIFVLLVCVFADTNIFEYLHTRRNLRRLEDETEHYRRQSSVDSLFVRQMETDEFIERYAREQFYMHAADEELYIVETEK